MQIQKNVSLAKLTTMRVGGPARFFYEVKTVDELKEAVLFAKRNNLPIFILGDGSNIIVSDDGFEGLVIKLNIRGVDFTDSAGGKTFVTAHAGENWDSLVALTVEKNLYGLENLSLIPGTAGAAPVQNIGAYGSELRDALEWVKVFDTETMTTKRLTKEECAFRYRDSIFKSEELKNLIVLEIGLVLEKDGILNIDYKDVKNYFKKRKNLKLTSSEVRGAVIAIRSLKLPDPNKVGTVGSFFKNPIIHEDKLKKLQRKYGEIPFYYSNENQVKVSLAWVLDVLCGLKGFRKGDIGVWEKQALVLVNYGKGTAREIREITEEIKNVVKEKIGIEPEYEVSFIGNF